MNKALINFITFQIGWFSCVLGAANGYPMFGPAVVAGAIAVHLWLAEDAAREAMLLLFAGALGAIFDSALVQTGWLLYPNGIIWDGTAPYWIVAMWLVFASTLNLSLRWMRRSLASAFLLGAIGGPLSYLAGERLGGLEFVDRQAALTALTVGWALVTPLLVVVARRLDGMSSESAVQRA